MNYCLIGNSSITDYLIREWYDLVPERDQIYCLKEFTICGEIKVKGDEWECFDMLSFDDYDKYDKKKAREILNCWMNKNKLVFVLTEHEIENDMKTFFEKNRFEIIDLNKEIGHDIEWDEFYRRLKEVLKKMKYPKITMKMISYNERKKEELDEKKPKVPQIDDN